MSFLGPLHPQIVHAPIVLIIVALLFDVVGRALDREWWRKAGVTMLVLGVLGAGAAVLSGEAASDSAEERQGIPEQTVDHHGDLAKMALWLGVGSLVARGATRVAGGARGIVSAAALALHLAAAITVGVAAHRGGMLVYHHGAAVRPHDRLVHDLEGGASP